MKHEMGTLIVLATAAVTGNVHAQPSYPEKPVRLIVNNVPGGAPDMTARVVGQKFGELWGQSVIIENIPGVSGNLGAARAAKFPADGYTFYSPDQGRDREEGTTGQRLRREI